MTKNMEVAIIAGVLAFSLVTCINTQAAEVNEEETVMIAKMTIGEAEGEIELGKRLVIDTILNRIDSAIYPNTVYEVLSDNKDGRQFVSWVDGRYENAVANEYVIDLVEQELEHRTNEKVMWFSRKRPKCGNRSLKVGRHIFTWRE